MHKKLLFGTAVKFLLENSPPPVQQPPPPQTPPTSTPAADPLAGLDQQPQTPGANEPGVDEIIGKLNVIRGGKSFSEPATYKAFTDFWATVQDKAPIISFLDGASSAVSGTETQTPNNQQPPPGGVPNTPPPAPTPQQPPPTGAPQQ
jgi:hypothetical protein